jgi:tetratricopeptide (TPR) repeat protein
MAAKGMHPCFNPQITCFLSSHRWQANHTHTRINGSSPRHDNTISLEEQPTSLQSHILRALSPLFATTILITTTAAPPLPALAENVRVEDVTSPTLRAGLEAANEGRLDTAERFFKMYIAQEDPSSASGFSNLGNVHLQQGKTQLALEDFTKAVDLAPEAAVPRLNRSIAYEQLGVDEEKQGRKTTAAAFYQKALEDCDAATAADPKEFAAWFDKGNVQMRLEDYTGALESFNRAADLAAIPGYRLRAATLQYQTGDVKKSMQTMRGIIRKNSNYAEARAALAAVNWAEGNVEVAEELLASAEDLDGALWKDISEVREMTRWPPALYDAYSRLLKVIP